MPNQNVAFVLRYLQMVLTQEPFDIYAMSGKGDENGVGVTLQLFMPADIADALRVQLQASDGSVQIGSNGVVALHVSQEMIEQIQQKDDTHAEVPLLLHDEDVPEAKSVSVTQPQPQAKITRRRADNGVTEEIVTALDKKPRSATASKEQKIGVGVFKNDDIAAALSFLNSSDDMPTDDELKLQG